MIVVDSNIIAYLYLPGEFTAKAERLLEKEPDWAAPLLWRSELRNILALYMRRKSLDFSPAYRIQREAEALMADHEYDVDSFEVLTLALESGCSAYDCEFVALAKQLGVRLVTEDAKLRRTFPRLTVGLAER
jgi:predicted nucleic acid-binding protein